MSVHHRAITPTEARLRLFHSGYHPLPLNGKNPNINGEGWQKKRLETNASEIELWQTMYPYATNTGILTRHTPFLDIDILDKDAAEACEALVAERFDNGRFLVRIGLSPKRGIPFRTDKPFPKILETLIAPNGNAHKIEFLADGQQVVVDGIHPDTKLPYRWYDDELSVVKREDLPDIDYERARKLIDDLVAMLIADHGYQREKSREEKKAERPDEKTDWDEDLKNLIDHNYDVPLAMALMRAGLCDGATVNLQLH